MFFEIHRIFSSTPNVFWSTQILSQKMHKIVFETKKIFLKHTKPVFNNTPNVFWNTQNL